MTRTLVATLLLVAACTDDGGDAATIADVTYEKVGAIAGEHHVVGLDTDGNGGLWLAYQMQNGPYQFDDLRLVHLAPDGTKLVEHRHTETDLPASGLAYAGGTLWLSHAAHTGDPQTRVRRFDAATGTELGNFPGEAGIVDLDMRGTTLLMSTIWREIVAVDAVTGAAQWRIGIPAVESHTLGIASAPEGIWVIDIDHWRALLVDDDGNVQATAAFAEDLADWWTNDDLQLAREGELLVVNRSNQIIWYAPRQP